MCVCTCVCANLCTTAHMWRSPFSRQLSPWAGVLGVKPRLSGLCGGAFTCSATSLTLGFNFYFSAALGKKTRAGQKIKQTTNSQKFHYPEKTIANVLQIHFLKLHTHMYYTYINIQYINAFIGLKPYVRYAVSSYLPFCQRFILDLLCVNKDAPTILSVSAFPLAAHVGWFRQILVKMLGLTESHFIIVSSNDRERASSLLSPLTWLLTPASEFHSTALSQPAEFPKLPFPNLVTLGG